MPPPDGGFEPATTLPGVDWNVVARRSEERYADGLRRLPDEPDARQKQLVRMATAAGAAGLAALMQGRGDAGEWFVRSAERYRESFGGAPAESWGRLIGALKSRLLAGDDIGAVRDARWALEQGPERAESPVGRYAAALARLVLGEDEHAAKAASTLTERDDFPAGVARALLALAEHDGAGYSAALPVVLTSFEDRERYLEDAPVADTVLVLERLARARGMAVEPASHTLPAVATF